MNDFIYLLVGIGCFLLTFGLVRFVEKALHS